MEGVLQKNEGGWKKTAEIIDTNLLIEKKSGVTTIFNIVEYPPAIHYSEIIYPTAQDYSLAFRIAIKLRNIGKPLEAIDILIASMCINRNLNLKTKDFDFEQIKEVEPSFQLEVLPQ